MARCRMKISDTLEEMRRIWDDTISVRGDRGMGWEGDNLSSKKVFPFPNTICSKRLNKESMFTNACYSAKPPSPHGSQLDAQKEQ